MSQTPFSFLAPFTGLYIVEGWGSGAGGRSNGGNGNGGGGCAYARTAGVFLIGGNSYSGATGDPGISNNNGDVSEFTAVMLADKGWDADFRGFGFGGLASNCIGDVTRDGGNGVPADGITGVGGGGGGAADDANAGNNAVGTTGGLANPRGGKGGSGPLAGAGNPGDGPGGGGSGGTGGGGGLGGRGAVIIWADLGVWPPIGQTPLATYGAPVPPFPNPPNPKLRKSVSII